MMKSSAAQGSHAPFAAQQRPAEGGAFRDGVGIGQHRFELRRRAEGGGFEGAERRLVGEEGLKHLVFRRIEESFSFIDEEGDGDRADAVRAMRIRQRGIAGEHGLDGRTVVAGDGFQKIGNVVGGQWQGNDDACESLHSLPVSCAPRGRRMEMWRKHNRWRGR
jgi:hypothetical protein